MIVAIDFSRWADKSSRCTSEDKKKQKKQRLINTALRVLRMKSKTHRKQHASNQSSVRNTSRDRCDFPALFIWCYWLLLYVKCGAGAVVHMKGTKSEHLPKKPNQQPPLVWKNDESNLFPRRKKKRFQYVRKKTVTSVPAHLLGTRPKRTHNKCCPHDYVYWPSNERPFFFAYDAHK